jgi:hypothetical protein
VDIYGGQDCEKDPGEQSPEVGQDLAGVVAASAKHGEEGIAEGAFQRTAPCVREVVRCSTFLLFLSLAE